MPVPNSIHDYLRTFAGELGERILQSFPALHNAHDPLSPRLATLLRKPFSAQTVAAMGVASVLLGLLAMFYPGATVVTIGIFFAAWLFVSGAYEVVTSFTRDGDTGSRVLHALIVTLVVVIWSARRWAAQSCSRSGLHTESSSTPYSICRQCCGW
jgi:hypothetical protein